VLLRRCQSAIAARKGADIAVLAAGAAPVSAVTTRAAYSSSAAAPQVPALVWTYKGTYPTLAACKSAGQAWLNGGSAARYKCTEINEGDYFVCKLYVVIQ
jgi:hypothetical protein